MSFGAYELLYKTGQQPVLGPPFLTLDSASFNQSDLRELIAFEYFCQQRIWAKHNVSGLLSPRFTQKTGIAPLQVEQFVIQNPGYTVYLFHPYPRELQLQNHFLDLAELEHPGITQALDQVWLQVLGRKRVNIELPAQQHLCCHCNYMLAAPIFWEQYSDFVAGFMKLLRSSEGKFLMHPTPYTLTKTSDSELPMAVFVFERALSHFIAEQSKEIKVLNYAYSDLNWNPPELFDGEGQQVDILAKLCLPPFRHKNGSIFEQKRTATLAYYNYRKLWSHT